MEPPSEIDLLRESLERSQDTAEKISTTLDHLSKSDRRKTWLLRGCGLALVVVFGVAWQNHTTARNANDTLAQVQADRLVAR